jgi:hypothetical protein
LKLIKLLQDNYDYVYVRYIEKEMDDSMGREVFLYYRFEYFCSVNDFLTKETNHISDRDKKFILKFDKEMKKMDYYFHITNDGRIKYRKDDFFLEIKFFKGFISLELNTKTEYMSQKHDYFDNVPEYIKKSLANSYGSCSNSIENNQCKKCYSKNRNKLFLQKKCKYMVIYTIEGKEIIKCWALPWFKFIPIISELSEYVKLIKYVYK